MADYPDTIFEPRAMENLNGLVRDVADVKNLYAEDYNEATAEIVAIETVLGLNPEGDYATVAERLDAGGGGGVGENFGNCDGGLVLSNFGGIDPLDGGGV